MICEKVFTCSVADVDSVVLELAEEINKGCFCGRRDNMEGEIRNARIKHVSLSMADHGCLTYGLTLDGGGIGVVYGGICLGHGYLGAKSFTGYGKSLEALMLIMDVVGVERWEDLTGKYVRFVNPGWGGTVDTIGNIIEDKWFNQREFFKELREETEADE